MALYLGIDTSNYTTSAAVFDTHDMRYFNISRPLPVEPGSLGLRQSDAVFNHVKTLPKVLKEVSKEFDLKNVGAIGVSTKPRNVPGSYMPCFLAGDSAARIISETLVVPCFEFSHQSGHIAAVLFSEKRLELLNGDFLAWHLSGGTTELLKVTGSKGDVAVTKIGGTTDISAGQLIDRCGAMLGLAFPAGRELDAMALESTSEDYYKIRVDDLCFSLSGMENKAKDLFKAETASRDIACFVLKSIANAVLSATNKALDKYPKTPVVMCGGVSGSNILKSALSCIGAVFAPPDVSSDNALGQAVCAAILSGGLRI